MDDNEDVDFVASEHDLLVSAITKLDKTQHITAPSRNEATNQNSEFNLIKRANKLKLDNVVKVLEDTAHSVQIGKKLKKTQIAQIILPKPLEKPQAERIKRATGYEETKKKVGRWDPVVARNRAVDFVSFPLKQLPSKLPPSSNHFISKFKLKSSLEKELDEVDPPPEVEEVEEEERIYPMSYEEMVEHRQHLAKLRAQQSYKAAKEKRQSKIKSKKYHRILKKEKLKQQLKEFEELQIKNPEEALKKLEELEKTRALERHTLRHKNTGKWAKSKLVRAKYDKEVRQQLAEQLSVSRSLTYKSQNTESTDDDGDDTENIPDISLAQDPLNPWMMKSSDKSNIDSEFNFGYKKYLKDKMYKQKEDSESDQENPEENIDYEREDSSLQVLKESVQKLSDINNPIAINDEPKIDKSDTEITATTNAAKNSNHQLKQTKTKNSFNAIATSKWLVEEINVCSKNDLLHTHQDITTVFEKLEYNIAGKVEEKLEMLRKQIMNIDRKSNNKHTQEEHENKQDSLQYLEFKNQNPKVIIDEELIETHKGIYEEKAQPLLDILRREDPIPDTQDINVDIDPNRFIEVKPKYLNTAVSKGENEFDDLEDEEQVVPKVDIEEVFEEDDVVASFRQEKQDEIDQDTPKQIDLTLPGWGTWGGKGVKAPKRKRNRFITKQLSKVPRRDNNKGNVIITECKNPYLKSHKVSSLPYPFTSVKDYEASIRTPIGNTFIPETAHKKLIRPSIITKAGTVIEPMDEEQLLVKSNRNFDLINSVRRVSSIQ